MNVLCGAREDTGEMQAARFTIHNQIPAYLLDRLDFHDRAVFEEHLVACAECQEELGGLTNGHAEVPLVDAPPVEPGRRGGERRPAPR
ncbi:MAG: zf-HC2 domain-containing protein [Thermoleophilaceae bacterium]|nr:zf-HC2 domain-containing protein [Thermoleophilaceae bacterium]